MSKILTKSKDMSTEYCATVVQLGEVKPIENSDFLGVVEVEGRDIVVRKDDVKAGDVMIYVSNECQLNLDFLSAVNEFEDISLNANAEAVMKTVDSLRNKGVSEEDILAYKRQNRGYFGSNGRVRMKKLRGVMSMGYLIKLSTMKVWDPEFNLDINIGEDFDTVNGKLFVKAYVPESKEHHTGTGPKDRNRKLKKFNRLVPGQFAFHYDTQQLNRSMKELCPDTVVTISVKEHGTSLICGNIKVKMPRWDGFYAKIFNYLPSFLQWTKEEYDAVYSSRKVIINEYINPNKGEGFAGGAVQKEIALWSERIKKYIPEGMTVYGEIVGYYDGTNTGIQSIGGKVCDYGAKPGTSHLMIYRITKRDEETKEFHELNVPDVYEWTKNLKKSMMLDESTFYDRVTPINILYHGKMRDLYPINSAEILSAIHLPEYPEHGFETVEEDKAFEANCNEINLAADEFNRYLEDNKANIYDYMNTHPDAKYVWKAWREVVLEYMKYDKSRFGMELKEPMCVNKVPREGIVLRIDDDPRSEAFKLKCLAFLSKEAEDVDKGVTSDAEMMERYN